MNLLHKAGSLVMRHFRLNRKVCADQPESLQGGAVCSRISYCAAEEPICFSYIGQSTWTWVGQSPFPCLEALTKLQSIQCI